jgi:hypothetical protein
MSIQRWSEDNLVEFAEDRFTALASPQMVGQGRREQLELSGD